MVSKKKVSKTTAAGIGGLARGVKGSRYVSSRLRRAGWLAREREKDMGRVEKRVAQQKLVMAGQKGNEFLKSIQNHFSKILTTILPKWLQFLFL